VALSAGVVELERNEGRGGATMNRGKTGTIVIGLPPTVGRGGYCPRKKKKLWVSIASLPSKTQGNKGVWGGVRGAAMRA